MKISDDEVRAVYTSMFVAALGALTPRGLAAAGTMVNDDEGEFGRRLAYAAEVVATYGVESWARSLNNGVLQGPCEELDEKPGVGDE